MRNRYLSLRTLGALALVAFLSVLLATPPAQAQGRERTKGRSSSRVERSKERAPKERTQKATAPRREAKKATKVRSQERSRDRSDRRERAAKRDRPSRTKERSVTRSTTTERKGRSVTRETTRTTRTTRDRDRNRNRDREVRRDDDRRDQRVNNRRDQRVDTRRDRRDQRVDNRRDRRDQRVDNRRDRRDQRVDNRRQRIDSRQAKRYREQQRRHRRWDDKRYYRPKHRHHYRAKHHRKHRYHYYYPKRYFRARPFIHIDVHWPWRYRYRRHWSPRYVYKQVIYVEAGWGQHHRDARVDVRTHYRHRVRYADDYKAELDIYIDQIEFYEDGYFLGTVDRIPGDLARIRATVYRDGHVEFDRDVSLVGNSYDGFEMISTRYYDDYVLNAYRTGHGLRAGRVDLRRGRVQMIRHSRLFAAAQFEGHVPISLLPEENSWLFDYGQDAISANYYGDDEGYFYGGASVSYSRSNDGHYLNSGGDVIEPLRVEGDYSYQTAGGASIRVQREAEIVRVQ